MSSLLVFNRVYRLEIQSVMLVFSTPLMNWADLSLTSPFPPFQSKRTVDTDSVWLWGVGVGGGGVELCCIDHILQEFNTLFLTRFRAYKIATPPQTKTPVKTTFRDWCLFTVPSSMGWKQQRRTNRQLERALTKLPPQSRRCCRHRLRRH
jgi:hypothetical protein